MRIELSPQTCDGTLTLHRDGDRLTIDGACFDFAPLPEGATLPPGAVACRWLASGVTRVAGALHLTLILPQGGDAPEGLRFPAVLDPVPQGAVPLPGAEPPPEPVSEPAPQHPGVIDWAQLETPDPAADLAQARAAAEAALLGRIDAVAEALTGLVPLAEKLSWIPKEEAAQAIADGTASPADRALLEGEAAVTGESVADLAARILKNAGAWRLAIAWLSGLRRRTLAALAQAPDAGGIAAALAEGMAALARPPD